MPLVRRPPASAVTQFRMERSQSSGVRPCNPCKLGHKRGHRDVVVRQVPLVSYTPSSFRFCRPISKSTGDSIPLFVCLHFGLLNISMYSNTFALCCAQCTRVKLSRPTSLTSLAILYRQRFNPVDTSVDNRPMIANSCKLEAPEASNIFRCRWRDLDVRPTTQADTVRTPKRRS